MTETGSNQLGANSLVHIYTKKLVNTHAPRYSVFGMGCCSSEPDLPPPYTAQTDPVPTLPPLTLERLRDLLPTLEAVWTGRDIGVLSWRLLPPEIQRFYLEAPDGGCYKVKLKLKRQAAMWRLLSKFALLEAARRQDNTAVTGLSFNGTYDLDTKNFWTEAKTGWRYIATDLTLNQQTWLAQMQDMLVVDINKIWIL